MCEVQCNRKASDVLHFTCHTCHLTKWVSYEAYRSDTQPRCEGVSLCFPRTSGKARWFSCFLHGLVVSRGSVAPEGWLALCVQVHSDTGLMCCCHLGHPQHYVNNKC